MKIIHILLGKANPHTMNGVNKIVHFLATEQFRAGHDVEVWGISASKRQPAHNHEYILRIFPVNKLRLILSKKMQRAITQLSPPIWVQMHSVFIPEFVSIAKMLCKRNVRYGITPHGAYAPGSFHKNRFMKRIYIALFESRLLQNASLIHATGESEVDDIHQIAPTVKTILVPNGQNLSFLNGFIPKHIQTSRPVFGFCGRLAMAHKGLDLLIEGFFVYKKQGGKGLLWLVGDGPDRASLEARIKRRNLSQDVVFHGVRFDQEKLQLLSNMDVFIHTSRWEGMPMSCLQAAAIGKPLLISKETNMHRHVAKYHSGWVLFSNEVKSISLALRNCEEVYCRGKIDELGFNALKMIKNEFSWTKISDELTKEWSFRL